MLLSLLPLPASLAVGPNMHIPDGYFGPLFAIALWIVALPWLGLAMRQLSRQLNQRMVPLVALFAAFSFVIMMFNVPLIGGTTGHAIGGTIAAIVIGPAGAAVAVSIALLIQALFFGDGGILAYGGNILLMALILPYTASFIYRALGGNTLISDRRRLIASFVAGWASLSLIAGLAGVMFGLQPILFHAADGTPLYAPFPIQVSVPAMLIPHMLVASVIEGLVTAGIVAYLQRGNPELLEVSLTPGAASRLESSRLRPLWMGLAALVVLSPLGLLAAGSAWGEWAADEIADIVGFTPPGLAETQSWSAPIPDYAVPGLNANLGYIFSAGLGIALTLVVIWVVGSFLARRTTAQKG